jgi:uncharacterized protein YndB with AHSA1/START domain
MAKIRKTVTIHAPVDRVFGYAGNPQNVPEYWPSMIEVANVKEHASGGFEFDWTYKMAGMKFHGHATPTEYEPNHSYTVRNEKGITSTSVWTFSGENGGSRIAVELDYEIPASLLGKLAERFLLQLNEREVETVLENIKSRCERAVPIGIGRPSRPSLH